MFLDRVSNERLVELDKLCKKLNDSEPQDTQWLNFFQVQRAYHDFWLMIQYRLFHRPNHAGKDLNNHCISLVLSSVVLLITCLVDYDLIVFFSCVQRAVIVA